MILGTGISSEISDSAVKYRFLILRPEAKAPRASHKTFTSINFVFNLFFPRISPVRFFSKDSETYFLNGQVFFFSRAKAGCQIEKSFGFNASQALVVVGRRPLGEQIRGRSICLPLFPMLPVSGLI